MRAAEGQVEQEGTHASEEDLRWMPENFGEAEHEVEGLARVTAVGAAEVVECRSTAWPYPGPWLRSRTWRVSGEAGRASSLRP